MAKDTGSTILWIVLGGILGGYVGVLLGLLIPTGILNTICTQGFDLGFNTPIVLDLRIVVLTFGLKLFLNAFGVIGMIFGLYYSK